MSKTRFQPQILLFLTPLLAVLTVTTIASPAFAQTADQLRSCQDFIRDRVPEFSRIRRSDIRVIRSSNYRRNGAATVRWQIPSRGTSGICLVNRQNNVIEFKEDRRYDGQGSYSNLEGNNRAVEYRWGRSIRPYLGRISGGSATIVDRPLKTEKRDVGRVSDGEQVMVFRTYQDNEGDVVWFLIKGSKGQEGWINSRRVKR
jgi:hypothetical protein